MLLGESSFQQLHLLQKWNGLGGCGEFFQSSHHRHLLRGKLRLQEQQSFLGGLGTQFMGSVQLLSINVFVHGGLFVWRDLHGVVAEVSLQEQVHLLHALGEHLPVIGAGFLGSAKLLIQLEDLLPLAFDHGEELALLMLCLRSELLVGVGGLDQVLVDDNLVGDIFDGTLDPQSQRRDPRLVPGQLLLGGFDLQRLLLQLLVFDSLL